jgi:hypothetical protein
VIPEKLSSICGKPGLSSLGEKSAADGGAGGCAKAPSGRHSGIWGVLVAVGVGLGTSVGVGVENGGGLGVFVGVGVEDGGGLGVFVGVGVDEGGGVGVFVGVGVDDGGGLGVLVGVGVEEGGGLGLLEGVAVTVAVGEGVGVISPVIRQKARSEPRGSYPCPISMKLNPSPTSLLSQKKRQVNC